ncbi:MAG: exosortase [Immundisolibacteraceae bacterium]|nr:exosortase [Immundisolibacteraceae bacterium]
MSKRVFLAIKFAPLVLVYLAFLGFNREFISPLLAAWWSSHEASQGLLILPVAVYLVFRQLARRPDGQLQPSLASVILFILASGVMHIGRLVNVQLVEFSAIVVAFSVIPLALYGVRNTDQHGARESYFPALYGLLALPVWDFSNYLFQLASLKVTELFLGLSPIPHYVEGFRIELASGVFLVDAGCSGLRYMVSAVAISLLYAYLYFRTWGARVVCVGSLLSLALLGNWLRIILIVLIGYVTDMQSPLVNDHATFGWIIFAVLLVVWMVAMRKLEYQE